MKLRIIIGTIVTALCLGAGFGTFYYLQSDPQGPAGIEARKALVQASEQPSVSEPPPPIDDGSDRTTTILNVLDSLDMTVTGDDFKDLEVDISKL